MGWMQGLVAATVVSAGAVGAGIVALGVVGFLLTGLLCWVSWAPLSREVCIESVADVERMLDQATSEGRAIEEARALTPQLDAACRNGTLGSWHLSQVETSVEKDLMDGRWTKNDQRRFARQVQRLLNPTGKP
jgi:hypothetical protein